MPATINQQILDSYTRRTVLLFRVDAALRKQTRSMLQKLEATLLQQLADIDPSGPDRLSVRQARVVKLQKQIRDTLTSGFNSIKKNAASELRDLAEVETAASRRMIDGLLGVDFMTTSVPRSVLQTLASDAMIQGTPAAEHWARIGGNTQNRFMDTVRQGVLQGLGASEIARAARQGGLEATRREAEALVRTAVLAVANQSNEATFRANSDVLRGVQAVVTFDLRTTALCISRSGGAWDLETGDPLPDSAVDIPYPGAPPWHFNCRTIIVPVVKSLRQIAKLDGDLADSIPKGTRASMDGQIPEDTTFHQWLKDRPFADAVELLGRQRAELWRDGSISLTDLVDQTGRELRVSELRDMAA